MGIRIVVAKSRGAGLGNELFPWAKGWIASQVLDARLVGPSWGRSRRGYYRDFGASRLDFVLEKALLRLPHHAFTESDYRATGEVDFGRAIERWGATRGVTREGSFVVSVEGMWGGYPSIWNARPFLLAKLLNSRDALRNVYEVISKLDRNKLFVAVGIRSTQGGFRRLNPGESARGKWTIVTPKEWYLWVCAALQQRFGKAIQFRIFTDRRHADFDEVVERFNPGQSHLQGRTQCSDLLLMAQADLLVCAVSSYSKAAAFFSGNPYICYEPQLTLIDGLYSLWGNEPYQQKAGSLTRRSMEFVSSRLSASATGQAPPLRYLGTPMDIGDALPDNLVEMLEQKLCSHDSRTNLIEYGCLPALRRE